MRLVNKLSFLIPLYFFIINQFLIVLNGKQINNDRLYQ